MILLHRLAADNFKQLKSVELRFPDSGAILIEGHNEAGKSSLFEAVFFALFGRALGSDAVIADLKRYGEDAMEVALDFSIAGRAFSITRTLGKTHRAKMTAPNQNGVETISGLKEIQKRLRDEMRLSSDALLNTCFVEQKRLERLEDMNRDARRDAINELLNLKILSDLETHFKITREAREEIEAQKRRVEIARLDDELPAMQEASARAEYSLQAARRRGAQKAIAELDEKIADAQIRRGEIEVERRAVARDLESAARFAAQLQLLDGELALRLEAWRAAEESRAGVQQSRDELRARASTLPAREAALDTHKQWAQTLQELEIRAQEITEVREFWARWKDVATRRETARVANQTTHQITQSARRSTNDSFPKIFLGAPILVAAVVLAASLVFTNLATAIAFSVASFVIAALLVSRFQSVHARADAARDQPAAQQELAVFEGELRALASQRPATIQNKSDTDVEALLREYSDHARADDEVRQLLAMHDLPAQAGALQTQLALREHELSRECEAVLRLDELAREQELKTGALEKSRAEFGAAWSALQNGDGPQGEAAPLSVGEAALQLDELRESLALQAQRVDAKSLRAREDVLREEYSALDRQIAAQENTRAAQQEVLHQEVLQSLPGEIGLEGDERDNEQQSIEDAERVLAARRESVVHQRALRRATAQQMGLGEDILDLQHEVMQMAKMESDAAIKRRAGEIVARTRGDLVSRVMPLTLANVRRVLPLLTQGRYRDAQWDEDSNVLAIYDSQAQGFVRKKVFSGGARDQISLALRLAFALATLPGEHDIRPNFLFLDEPLSSFDAARTQALVELLTRGLIRQSFGQIFLVSHSQSFDAELFDFRIEMQSGRVIESTLPSSTS